MPRCQGVELEDLSLCPAWLRDEATEVLVRGLELIDWPGAILKVWQPWLAALGYPVVVDCCSGSAGPIGGILKRRQLQVRLTDLYPNLGAWEALARQYPDRVSYETNPVDARCLPPDLLGVWSFFNSFHHFDPASARKILSEALHRGQPLAVFEALERRWSRLLLVLLMPVLSLVSALWLRPFRWRRLNPLIPLLLTWDGLMSCFRIYSPSDWAVMIEEVDPNQQFEWTVGSMPLGRIPLSCGYVLAKPRMFAESSGEA